MTPLAAGVGKVSRERWAAQTVLAMRHFWEAVERPLVWGALQWDVIERVCEEVAGTWKSVDTGSVGSISGSVSSE